MAYYAFLDENNVVTEVIKGEDEGNYDMLGNYIPSIIDWEVRYAEIKGQPCKRTSFNTRGGIYYDPNTGQPAADQLKAFRKNYAGIDYSYDHQLDAFIPPKPYPSWVLDPDTCTWKAPIPYPTITDPLEICGWDEDTQSWVKIPDFGT
jgi:hypothetical protein